MIKTYAYIKFELTSPLSLGYGKGKETDKDVIQNAKGEPYIPASSLAGVYRSLFNEGDQKKYFGYVDIDRGNSKPNQEIPSAESSIITYDARVIDSAWKVSIRDGVRLDDEYRNVIEGTKYDYQVVDPGAQFWTAIEWTESNKTAESENPLNHILKAWKDGRIAIGAKTMRGLGSLKSTELKVVSFDLSKAKAGTTEAGETYYGLEEWLDFDLYADDEKTKQLWRLPKLDLDTMSEEYVLELTLKQNGPMIIRVPSTEVSQMDTDSGKKESEVAPDSMQLVYRKINFDASNTEVAVIPGTSWAGIFRHRMKTYLKNDIGRLFGVENGRNRSGMRSKIKFSETYFENGQSQIIARNAIDRFSSGVASTALFFEKMYFGGSGGKLRISFPKEADEQFNSKCLRAIAICVADLHEGFLTVGGESAIGHGLFSVTDIRFGDKTLTAERINAEKGSDQLLDKGIDRIDGEMIYQFITKIEV